MKLTANNPLNGDKVNLTDPQSWIQNVLGVLFLFVVFASGQKVAQLVESKTKFDTSPTLTVNTPPVGSNKPNMNVY